MTPRRRPICRRLSWPTPRRCRPLCRGFAAGMKLQRPAALRLPFGISRSGALSFQYTHETAPDDCQKLAKSSKLGNISRRIWHIFGGIGTYYWNSPVAFILQHFLRYTQASSRAFEIWQTLATVRKIWQVLHIVHMIVAGISPKSLSSNFLKEI